MARRAATARTYQRRSTLYTGSLSPQNEHAGHATLSVPGAIASERSG